MVKYITLGILALGAVSAPALGASPYISSTSRGYSIGIRGLVPVICRATFDAKIITRTAGKVRIGSLNEFCNSPNGYEVYADFSQTLAQATLLVDGNKIKLSSAGTALVSRSNRPSVQHREIFLDLPEGVESGNISFRAVPL